MHPYTTIFKPIFLFMLLYTCLYMYIDVCFACI